MSTEHAVLLLDDRRVFVAANESVADLLGTTVEHLLGRRADEFMPVVARAVYPLAWKAFRVRRTAAGEYAAQREDGTLAHLAYVGSPIGRYADCTSSSSNGWPARWTRPA